MKLPFKIKEIKPSVFLFEFTNQFDMCMHFLRYQEFYESPNKKFRNKSFTIFEFMKWQAETEGSNSFTYPAKWSGFNIPSHIFHNCIKSIKDNNKYDKNMVTAFYECVSNVDNAFYIIGCLKGNDKTMQHELAHSLYYLNSNYKKEAIKLVKALPVKIKTQMEKMLTKYGYTKQVFIDEIQAYFSTDSKEDLIARGIKLTNHDVKFKELFNAYNL